MREESIHELGNMAHQRAHLLEGRKGGGAMVRSKTWDVANKDSIARGEEEGRGRSGPVSLETWHIANANEQGLTCWRRGKGRSEVVALEIWNIANKDSPT